MAPKTSLLASLSSLTGVTARRKKRGPFPVVCVLALLGFAAPAKASTVGCAGASGGPFDFTSLTAAIAASPGGNTLITVSGTCTEAVVIASVQNLGILGTPGAALVDPGGSPPNFGAVLEIDDSQGVTVGGLTIQLAPRPPDTQISVVVVSNSNVTFRGCRIEGAGASLGIEAHQSTVRLIGATVVENNNDGLGDGIGVLVVGPSANLLLLRDPLGNCPLIRGNDGDGIAVHGGGAHLRIGGIGAPRGCATIQNNGIGIVGRGGATITLKVSQATPGAIQVLNNVFGVNAGGGSSLDIRGPVLIQGNSVLGVRVARGAIGSIGPSDGTSGPIIRQNGFSTLTPPSCCALPAGISVAFNAQLDISAALVTDNSAPGLLVQDDSSVRIIGSVGSLAITQNPVGVSVTNVSTAALFLAPSISGNVGFDLACGPDSVAYGDLSAVGKSDCPQFRRVPNPGQPPGPGKEIP